MNRRLALLAGLCLIASPVYAQTITSPPGPVTGYQVAGAAVVTNAGAVLTTSQAQAVGGSTSIPFASTATLTAGDVLAGTSIPNGDEIVTITGVTQQVKAANGSFSSGQKVILMADTGSIAPGWQCTDVQAGGSGVIGAGNLVASRAGNTSITMTSNMLTNSVGAADSIQCDPVVTMFTTTSAAVASGAAVSQYPGGTSYTAPGQLNFLGGFWSSAASGIAGLSFVQGGGGGHNWGIGGRANTFGAGTTSYAFGSPLSDTDVVLELFAQNGRVIDISGSSNTGTDVGVNALNDNRLVLKANNGGVFEIANGNSTGTGSFAGVVCCHAWADRSYAGGSQTGAISPTAGSTVSTLVDGTTTYDGLYLTPAGTLATLTINLQATPADGQELTILSTQVVTALTFSAGGSLTLGGGLPSALAANVPVKLKCINTTGSAGFQCQSSKGGTWVPWL